MSLVVASDGVGVRRLISVARDFLAEATVDSGAKSVLMYNLVRAVVAELADALA